MIYTDWSTPEARVAAWWRARGCHRNEDIVAYVERQPVETLEAWRDWLRAEVANWRDAANAASDDLAAVEPGEPSDDAGTAYDEARDSADDCRRMLEAVTAKLEGMTP